MMMPFSGTGSWIEALVAFAAVLVLAMYVYKVFFGGRRNRRVERAELRAAIRYGEHEFREEDQNLARSSDEPDLQDELHDALHPTTEKTGLDDASPEDEMWLPGIRRL